MVFYRCVNRAMRLLHCVRNNRFTVGILAVALSLTLALGMFPNRSSAQEPNVENQPLNQQLQDLKKQVLALNRDLFILEEELLFPSNTQVSVFLSMDIGEYFQLDAVKLTLDNRVVTNYLYTERQVDALHRGGVQRLYMGNIKAGKHEVVAVFTGRGPKGRDFRRGTTVAFEKGASEKHIELKIVDSQAKQQPEFEIKEW